MKKVCFFITSLNSGGIENYLLRFLMHYKDNIDATVICKGGVFGELENKYRELPHIRLFQQKIRYFDLKEYYRLFQFIKKEQYDAICDFTGNFAGIIMLIGKQCDIKNRIVFYRGSTNRFVETKFKIIYNKFVNLLVKKYATSILSNSQAALSFFFNKPDKRLKVIYNGIERKDFSLSESKENIRESLYLSKKAFVVGHTGRVHFSKNQETIIQVANILCRKYSDIYFVLCGKNTDVVLPQLINDDVKSQVRLLGYRSDIPRVLKSFDVYFFPSVTEGQPNALIEAMISDLPIIASDIEPIKETVPEDFVSHLISPYDINRFVSEIEKLYLNKDNNISCSLKEWAATKFNPTIQFGEFYKMLTL